MSKIKEFLKGIVSNYKNSFKQYTATNIIILLTTLFFVFALENLPTITDKLLLFTRHYPARCFGMNMPKSRDIQAKIPLPQAIWNEFWLRYCERSEQ